MIGNISFCLLEKKEKILFSFLVLKEKKHFEKKKKVYNETYYSYDRSGVDLTNSQTRPRRTLPYTQPQPNRLTYLASGYLERFVGYNVS